MDHSDIQLVLFAKAGQNDRAFAELVRRHQARLRAFLTRLCGSPVLADDLAQNTFLKAHSAIQDFTSGKSFRAWLTAIAYREFLMHCRKEKSDARLKTAINEQQTIIDKNTSDISIDLQRSLRALDEKDRAAILLCDAAGYSHSEASTVLDLPLGSVKTCIARARKQMREFMEAGRPPLELSDKATGKPIINGASYAI